MLRAFLGSRGSQQAAAPKPRNAWHTATHRLVGLFGLDPAGNVICRLSEGNASMFGWFSVVQVGSTKLVPYHWIAHERLAGLAAAGQAPHVAPTATRTPAAADTATPSPTSTVSGGKDDDAAAATAQTTATPITGDVGVHTTADGLLRIDPRLRLQSRKLRKQLRLNAAATFLYKVFYYGCWVGFIFGCGAGYLYTKTQVMDYHTRQRLNALESRFYSSRSLADLEAVLRSYGVPEALLAWLRIGSAYATTGLTSGAMQFGYDPFVHHRDEQATRQQRVAELMAQAHERRKVALWQLFGVIALFFVALFAALG
jgi:hypothetical protein